MEARKSGVLGHLVEITGDCFIAKLAAETGSLPSERLIGMDKVSVGQIGSYLLVIQSGHELLCSVESMWIETDKSNREIHKIRLIPLGEFDREKCFDRGITHYPTTGAEIHSVSKWNLERIFSEYNEVMYKVGKLRDYKSIDVCLDVSNLFGRHVAILGQTGSGKSWTVTSLIQSALHSMPNAHIVIMDMHGEYGDSRLDRSITSPFPGNKVRCMDAFELEMPYWLLTYSNLVDIFINPADSNAPVQRAFLRTALHELRVEANKHLDLGHITVDSPVYFSLDELHGKFVEANQKTSDSGRIKGPLFGELDQFLVRMQSLMNDNRYDFMFKPVQRTSTETLVDLITEFVGLGERQANVTVLNLSAVPSDVVPMVTALIGRLILEFNFWNPKCLEFPILLVCEEAQEYIPREENTRFRESRNIMERISKVGRKYGVGLCVVSQRPANISETVLSQIGTYLCLRISNPDDQAYLRAMVPDAARGTFSSLTALAHGEAVAMGAAVPMPVRFQINPPNPPPNSQNVDFATKWKDGGEGINIEELVSNWHKHLR